jgi:hypothetical protein
MSHILDEGKRIRKAMIMEAAPGGLSTDTARVHQALGACSYLLLLAVSKEKADRDHAKAEVERLLEVGYKYDIGLGQEQEA